MTLDLDEPTAGGTPPFAGDPDRACADLDFPEFFPTAYQDMPAVKRVCHRCPVREACLDWALDHDEYGIWGGTTDHERAAIRRIQQVAPVWVRQRAGRGSRLKERRQRMLAMLDRRTAREIAAAVGVHERTVVRFVAKMRQAA